MKQTLLEFQKGEGIRFEDQIVLINNHQVFDGYTPCFNPWKNSFSSRMMFELARIGSSLLPNGKASKVGAERVFAGYFDRSFDHLDRLDKLFLKMKQRPDTEFELVIGKGDYVVDENWLTRIPNNLKTIHLNSVNVVDSRLRLLPMGRDFRSIEVFKNRSPCVRKKLLCYCNFSVNTHPVRKQVAAQLRDKSFVTQRHMGDFLNYEVSRDEFFDDLESSKFCICPRGNAFDTFRMWDALYSGTVPIVVREAVFHDQLSDLPILFLAHCEEFQELNESGLEATYDAMLHREYNFEKLKTSFWLN